MKTTWPSVDETPELDAHQRLVLQGPLSSRSRIVILGGSPGTGKTYSAAAIIRAAAKSLGPEQIAVCAPTGKAAVRLSEAMTANGLHFRARTIHSLLSVRTNDSSRGGGWSFDYNADNPLPHRLIVVDETSMVDASLMSSLLSARNRGASVLLIGDINQLPPVGHGAPLRDLIGANVPYGELTQIRRNSGAIVRACGAIRDGREPTVCDRIDLTTEDPENLYLARATKPEQRVAKMLAAIEAARSDGLDPVWDVQTLAAVNAKSDLGRKKLNEILQRELNKTGEKAGGNPFLVGDKIVCLKNCFLPVDEERDSGEADQEDGKVFVANGELAAVIEVQPNLTTARLTSPNRVVKIPRGKSSGSDDSDGDDSADTGCNWDLGYALSVHKSQGSEWPVVLLMLDTYPGARRVCSREWLYTGLSRAKRLCVPIGQLSTMLGMCKREALSKRKTFLSEQIGEQLELRSAMAVVD